MKKFLVAVIILSASVNVFAGTKEEKLANPKFKVTTNLSAKKANLTFIPSGDDKVIVRILDASGMTIFQEQLREGEAFSRPYDMSNLASAEYTMVVKEGDKTYSEAISFSSTISSNEVANFSAEAKVAVNGKVTLKVLQSSVSPVFVAIKNNAGNVLYTNAISNEASFIQNFDISKINESVYFEVRSSNSVKTIEL